MTRTQNMVIISSQRHLDQDVVDEKMQQLAGVDCVELPIVYAGQYGDDDVYVLVDGHHTLAAARALGVEVTYTERSRTECNCHPDWTLEQMLDHLWMDSDWYDIHTGVNYF
ncbi:MAG: hypothetical protein KatS3mg038_3902 [Candidatus Kapaibacterium sp.]|nr:MAG: hypothetical protein KatS3mg038_2516 [Candidatus Kapabacteria bacterium]GIV53109.1 MAG: hypothetical protein KatS3mg038_3630 [Candidatus Kapabacteria bacterium]GIV53381.1 MAG: hypothetical protein KatS3mg038_3902 [Candidatus Kapabacteria bacterium]